MDHDKPGLYLAVGPPLTFEAVFRDGQLLKKFCYEMTPQQASELGETLIKLAGAAEVPASCRVKRQAPFLSAAEVN
jgi:hypothetical protein